MQELINKIIEKAIKISNTTKHHVVVNYYGNSKNLLVNVDEMPEILCVCLNEDNVIEKLQEVLDELKKYEEE